MACQSSLAAFEEQGIELICNLAVSSAKLYSGSFDLTEIQSELFTVAFPYLRRLLESHEADISSKSVDKVLQTLQQISDCGSDMRDALKRYGFMELLSARLLKQKLSIAEVQAFCALFKNTGMPLADSKSLRIATTLLRTRNEAVIASLIDALDSWMPFTSQYDIVFPPRDMIEGVFNICNSSSAPSLLLPSLRFLSRYCFALSADNVTSSENQVEGFYPLGTEKSFFSTFATISSSSYRLLFTRFSSVLTELRTHSQLQIREEASMMLSYMSKDFHIDTSDVATRLRFYLSSLPSLSSSLNLFGVVMLMRPFNENSAIHHLVSSELIPTVVPLLPSDASSAPTDLQIKAAEILSRVICFFRPHSSVMKSVERNHVIPTLSKLLYSRNIIIVHESFFAVSLYMTSSDECAHYALDHGAAEVAMSILNKIVEIEENRDILSGRKYFEYSVLRMQFNYNLLSGFCNFTYRPQALPKPLLVAILDQISRILDRNQDRLFPIYKRCFDVVENILENSTNKAKSCEALSESRILANYVDELNHVLEFGCKKDRCYSLSFMAIGPAGHFSLSAKQLLLDKKLIDLALTFIATGQQDMRSDGFDLLETLVAETIERDEEAAPLAVQLLEQYTQKGIIADCITSCQRSSESSSVKACMYSIIKNYVRLSGLPSMISNGEGFHYTRQLLVSLRGLDILLTQAQSELSRPIHEADHRRLFELVGAVGRAIKSQLVLGAQEAEERSSGLEEAKRACIQFFTNFFHKIKASRFIDFFDRVRAISPKNDEVVLARVMLENLADPETMFG